MLPRMAASDGVVKVLLEVIPVLRKREECGKVNVQEVGWVQGCLHTEGRIRALPVDGGSTEHIRKFPKANLNALGSLP